MMNYGDKRRMTNEELDRIKKAYSSGLKVQIWFNGYWEDFDARDYSMYSDPFSENRQYRIVGSDYADIAEKRIAELEAQIEKLIDFVLSKTECCDVCPMTDTCINSEGTCPYAGILAKGEEEVTREWLMQKITKEIKEK